MNLVQYSSTKNGVYARALEQLRMSEVASIALHSNRAARLERLLAFLNSKSIDAMLIKGTALEILVYDRPWATTTRDIDVVLDIDAGGFSKADQAAFHDLAGGYSLEYDFGTHHDVTMNGILPVDFQKVWADAQTSCYHDQPCLVMSMEDMLISLCVNSCRKRYFSLKSLLDIAETIRNCKGLDWQIVTAKARTYRCSYIVYTALLATQITIGSQLPVTLQRDLSVSPLRARIILLEIERRVSRPLFEPKPSADILGRSIDTSLFLPYLTYRWDQILKRWWFVLRTRKQPMGLLDKGVLYA
jgi:hypothetical protein